MKEETKEDISCLPDECQPALIFAMFSDAIAMRESKEIKNICNFFQNTYSIPIMKDNETFVNIIQLLYQQYENLGNDLDELQIAPAKLNIYHEESSKETKGIEIEKEHKEKDSFRLLGDLPLLSSPSKFKDIKNRKIDQLNKEFKNLSFKKYSSSKKSQKKNKLRDRDLDISNSIEPKIIPKKYLCGINKYLMTCPMKTPTGYVYEKEAIQHWIKIHGSVCPLSGEELKFSDLTYDKELKQEITKWKLSSELKMTTKNLKEESKQIEQQEIKEGDLYDF